jgi:hypothetical protein
MNRFELLQMQDSLVVKFIIIKKPLAKYIPISIYNITYLLLILFVLIISMFQPAYSQNINIENVKVPYDRQISSKVELTAEPGVFANFIPVTNETKFIVSHYSSPNESDERDSLYQIKALKTESKNNYNPLKIDETNERAANLYIGRNFSGNTGYGCPNDNTIAVSSLGTIISGENSNFYYYSSNGVLLGYTTMSSLFSGVTSVPNLCDPKVVYDSGANRFILFSQVCNGSPSDSRLLLAFSITSNPLDGFYTYGFSGNPLNDNSWFDYPKIAVFTDEILITGNLYYGSGGNNQSVIYQINKNACYSGSPFFNGIYQFWYNITNQPFTILPLTYGQDGTIGPPYCLVNTHGTSSGNTLDFYQLTGEISEANEVINHWTVNVPNYSVPGNSAQLNGLNNIDVGDCRTMDGYVLDGYAHFVHIYDESGWSGIRYNRLKITELSHSFYNINYAGNLDYSYPSICSFGTSASDKSVLVNFLASGPSIYPQMRAKEIDDAMQSNQSIVVKSGESAVSDCYDPNRQASRWGDYTGAWRKPNSNPPAAWVSGCYGRFGSWGTWISEITTDPNVSINNVEDSSSISIYPNPASTNITVEIYTQHTGIYNMKIYSTTGNLIDFFELGTLFQGSNSIKYLNKLSTGTYFFSVYNKSGELVSNEKIIISY